MAVEAPARPAPTPAAEPEPHAPPPAVPGQSLLLRGVHLAVLSAFGIARPLLTEVDDPSLFIFFDYERIDVVLLALAVTLGPPALLLAVEALVSLASRRAAGVVHACFVAGLAGIFASQLIVNAWGPSPRVHAALAFAAGVAFAAAYVRAAPVRSVVTVLAPAPVLFLVLFLFFSPVTPLVVGSEGDPPAEPVALDAPVVVIVLDEMPATALMGADRNVDAARFPNFARLARRSTWFRNATTRHTFTEFAVPAIVSGRRSEEDSVPTASDHRRNLFSLASGGPVHAEEPVTRLCPTYACPNPRTVQRRTAELFEQMAYVSMRQWLPQPLARRVPAEPELKDATDPAQQVSRFADALGRSQGPGLHYLHMLMPHSPLVYLPSGKRYASRQENAGLVGMQGIDDWERESWPVVQAYQAFLLQVQYTDRLLGSVLDRLEESGMYDRALVMVVADHGVSHRPGDARREISPSNAADILSVPFFVKAPGQRRGSVNDAFVRNSDLVATLADVLEIRTPWPTGRSAFDRSEQATPRLDVFTRAGERVSVDARAFERERDESLRRQVGLLGSGRTSLLRIGPHPELIGRAPGRVASSARAGVALWGGARQDVDLSAPEIPARVVGTIVGPGAGEVRDLAVAVNGRVAATTRTFLQAGAPRFSALLPESALRAGRNEFRVYAVQRGRRLTHLRNSP